MKTFFTTVFITLSSTLICTGTSKDFSTFLKPLFESKCNECHGKKKTKGKVNLYELTDYAKFLTKPKLIKEVIEVLEANDMPPEDEPQLTQNDKLKAISLLKTYLQKAASVNKVKEIAFTRLNRFQYNYTVKDLFQLKKDPFHLTEKIMTRRDNYILRKVNKMPDRLNVFSASLNPNGGMKDVESFPQDLRALHGFDNQANQLTMSPLLLDSFLKLSLSIVNSPDFNDKTVGLWQSFFAEPKDKKSIETEIEKRLESFLTKAFRMPVDSETLKRYSSFAIDKINSGESFTETMKKVASTALSSPLFLYRLNPQDPKDKNLKLASKLSYFLWGSAPDDQLLALATNGQLSQSKKLEQTVERMLKDPKIERFLDSFPSQWMQLETIFSAAPDKKLYRNYSLSPNDSPSTSMALEPLLFI